MNVVNEDGRELFPPVEQTLNNIDFEALKNINVLPPEIAAQRKRQRFVASLISSAAMGLAVGLSLVRSGHHR